jgi:hypothetical protein
MELAQTKDLTLDAVTVGTGGGVNDIVVQE